MMRYFCDQCYTTLWDAFDYETHECALIECDCGHVLEQHAANYHQGCYMCGCLLDRTTLKETA